MSATRQAVLEAVRRRLAEEPDRVLPALRIIADPDAMVEDDDAATIQLAKTLNAHRVVASLRELRARSYTTAEVAEMLGGVSRQAVAQRVASGRLAAIEISRRLHFPPWQFVDGRPVPRLPELIAALDEVAHDAFVADGIMRTSLPEEGGRSPADLVADGEFDRALHYVRIAGGGF